MKCPFCGSDDTQVKDSRPAEGNAAIRRRRACGTCGLRFTTFERVQLRDVVVLKEGDRREPLERDKISRSMKVALRKRPVDAERVERAVSAIIRRIESSGQTEVPSKDIGELVMGVLEELDHVAYIRFASVYRDFREARDFGDIVKDLNVREKIA